jgi:hypothetical protein
MAARWFAPAPLVLCSRIRPPSGSSPLTRGGPFPSRLRVRVRCREGEEGGRGDGGRRMDFFENNIIKIKILKVI